MNILITGASGFIGKSVINNLKKNKKNKILAITRKKRNVDNDIKFIQGNIANLNGIKNKIKKFNPETVIHLAWEGIPDLNYINSYKNLKNSISFFELIFKETTCKKIIVSGSCLEYGKQNGICKESDVVKTNSYFSWSKTCLYNYLLINSLDKKIDLVWFRIFYAFGANQRKGSLIPHLLDSINKKKMPQIKNLNNKNDFIFIEDIADAFFKATKLKNFAGIINLGSGKKTSVLQICKLVDKKLNGSPYLFKKIKTNLSSSDSTGLLADITLAKNLLNWYPRFDIKKAINKII